MTSFTINNGTIPSGTTDTVVGARTDGIQFTVSEECHLDAWWYYVPAGESTLAGSGITGNLWTTVDGNTGTRVVASTPGSGTLTPGAWNRIPLSSPFTLEPGTHYVAGICHSVQLKFLSNFFSTGAGASGLSSGPIFVPGTATVLGGRQYATVGAVDTFPPGGVASWYGLDIEVSTISGSPGIKKSLLLATGLV